MGLDLPCAKEGDTYCTGSKASTGATSERRASLVIKETEDLLHGLHDEANRSDALMSELEALLAASRGVAATPCNGSAKMSRKAHFLMVQPLQELAAEDEARDEVEVSPTYSSSPVASRRRSSTILLDGSALHENGGNWCAGQGRTGAAWETCNPLGRSTSFTRGNSKHMGRSAVEDRPHADGPARRTLQGNVAALGPAAIERGPSGVSGGGGGGAVPVVAVSSFARRSFAIGEEGVPRWSPPEGPRALTSSGGALVAPPPATWARRPSGVITSPQLPDSMLTEDGYCEQPGAAPAVGRARSGHFAKMLSRVFAPGSQQALSAPHIHTGFTSTESSGQPLSPTISASGYTLLPTGSFHAALAPAPHGGSEAHRGAHGSPGAGSRSGSFTAQHGGVAPAPVGGRRASQADPLRSSSSSFGSSFSRASSRVMPSATPGASATAWALPAASSSLGSPLACSLSAGASLTEGAQQAVAAAGPQLAAEAAAAAALRTGRVGSHGRSMARFLPPM